MSQTPELVVKDRQSFFRLALELATTPELLAGLRARLASNRLGCALFDSARFTRDLERLYERMLENHRAGNRAHIVIGP